MSLDFKGQTALVTGAGGGLGKAYSLFFASRGANVVVNDVSAEAAQAVVDEIKKAGGKAVVNTSSVTEGDKVVKSAVDAFGGLHILINNAGILRDKSFAKMSDKEWDFVMEVHVKGSYSCTRAAWPIFRQQKYGRIINTASAAGLYGNRGQANYSSAKMALVAFTKTLALEGFKYGIRANVIAPMAKSAMTETVMPPDMLEHLQPTAVAPFVAFLCAPDGYAPDSKPVSGRIFEVGAGYCAEVRWERAKGTTWRPDDSFTPSAVKAKWEEVIDFDRGVEHPETMADASSNMQDILQTAASLPGNPQADPPVRYDGKTVIITGAGAGLGRAYALMFAKHGAQVVVSDVSEKGAKAVAEEIKAAGGKAISVVASAEDGEAIVKAAVDAFGSVHVLIANAGILRDKSFAAMSDKEWDDVIAVHLRGTYKCAKAVWPIFQKQGYGRIVTTGSAVALHGNFGQANYSTAKAGIIGLTRTLAIEGEKYGILANAIVPTAGTAMTATIWPDEMVQLFKPDFVAPVVGFLASEDNDGTGGIYQVAAGWAAKTRWQRAGGYGFPHGKFTPEDVKTKWNVITNFDDGRATHPESTAEALQQIVENFDADEEGADDEFADPEDADIVKEAKKERYDPQEFEYTERDVILYLGIGATEKDLQWVYENQDGFAPLPTFAVVPSFGASSAIDFGFLPNFSPMKLLHGEQYIKIHKPLPTSATLVNTAKLVEVLDKTKAAAVTIKVETKDRESGELYCENEMTVILRGSGGFGGCKDGKDRGAATAPNKPPKRAPDAVVEEKTDIKQAALYRLSGDYNPLHVDPNFAGAGGFDKPILHGLCSMGFAGKHVLQKFGPWQDIKVRFVGHVFPGETLRTEMWKEGDKVIFIAKVKERDSVAIAAAAATLVNDGKSELKARL